MNDLPILFSTFSVRAMLAGNKSKTRRAIKPQPTRWDTVKRKPYVHPDMLRVWSPLSDHTEDRVAPYEVRQRLWVRETTESYPMPNILTGEPTNAICARYVADKAPILDEHELDVAWWYSKPVCPSIFMPRWASRITIQITEVRAERVQEISAEDCIAEGCRTNLREQEACDELRDQYRAVWDSINGVKSPLGWKANPWVWALSFSMEEVRDQTSQINSVRG